MSKITSEKFFINFSVFLIHVLNVASYSLQAQDSCKCNYIESGYYQLVYEADIAYLEGKDSLAYEKLQKAEQTCPLLNQFPYQEMELYGRLLLKYNNFSKAIYYMEELATEYGKEPFYILAALEKDSILTGNLLLEYPAFNDSILPAIMQKYNEFYTSERKQLAAELTNILNSDQEVRANWEKKSKQADSTVFFEEMYKTDSLNAKRFFEIVAKYGYPNGKRYGNNFKNMNLSIRIAALIVHISTYFDIEEMILQYVRNGECEPMLFASIIDKGILEGKWKKTSLYGVWQNFRDDQIIDILHLDDRRMSIGMPTRAMEKRRNELMKR